MLVVMLVVKLTRYCTYCLPLKPEMLAPFAMLVCQLVHVASPVVVELPARASTLKVVLAGVLVVYWSVVKLTCDPRFRAADVYVPDEIKLADVVA